MGREIRMVPPNWEHPEDENGNLKSMYDSRFEDAAAEWKANFAKWESGEREDYCTGDSRTLEFWEWNGGPPDREYYRPWKDGEATWFQLWQTVSEGTPVSPPFATREELAAYLAEHGDFWDQSRGNGGWGKESADAFVIVGWAPTLMQSGGLIVDAKDIPLEMSRVQGASVATPQDSIASSDDGMAKASTPGESLDEGAESTSSTAKSGVAKARGETDAK